MARIGIYLRISEDKDGTQTATARQLEDCRKYAENRQWRAVDVFEDVDISAYQRTAKRPEFERMITAVRDKHIDGVLAWKIDRISRRQRDLVRLDEVCEEHGAFIASVVEGIDTRQPTGRFVAELLVAQARMESSNTATRVKRAHEQMAAQGRPANGGTRAFGYSPDRKTLVPEEAELIREAAKRVLAGEGLRRVCLDWERRNVVSPAGKPWQQPPLRRLLTNPMLSAQRVYNGAAIPGTWPAILTVEETARLRLVLLDPQRRKSFGNSRAYLLSGFLRCGRCGGNMVARPRLDKVRRYVCPRLPARPNCGRLSRLAEPVEDVVREMLFVALENADISQYVRANQRTDIRLLEEAIRADEDALERLTTDHYVNRLIERGEFLSARTTLEERLNKNRLKASEDRQAGVLGALMAGARVRELWDEKPLEWRRAVISTVIDHIELLPAVKGRNVFDPTLVKVEWKF